MRRKPRTLSAITLTLALGACVAGPPPEIVTPTPELPQEFLFTPDGETRASLASLMPYQDSAFLALTAAAQENAPSLAEAAARIEAARAGAKGVGANRLPNISADASVTETRINPTQFGQAGAGGLIPRTQTSYGANLVASWDPDIFGRLKARERAAAARLDAATASANAVRIALASEIAGAVIDWRTIDARATELEKDVLAARQLAGLAKVREDAGIAPGFDRVRAQAAASASQSRLAALESEKARLVGRLITLTGASGQTVDEALSTGGPFMRPRAVPSTLPSQLLTNRPDIIAAASELAATDAELASAARARFPSINLSGVIGLLAFNPANLFDEDSLVGSLAAGIAAPLLDFGRIEAEIDGAAANKKLAFASYRGAVFQALGDTEAAYGLIKAADAEAALAEKERDELQRAAALANTRYRAGLTDFLTVLEARRTADASGDRAAAALGRAHRARILLWQAVGGDTLVTGS